MVSFCPPSMAGVVISGTRVIYPSQVREITVQVSNVGDTPSLVQAWIDGGNPEQTAENSDAPFLLTPPIARVEAGRSQALRVIFTGADLPTDRESLFWLNVLDVAPSPKDTGEEQNYLQVAFRSRIKLFYRPKGLPQDANSAPAKLRWSWSGGKLRIDNPTPYHVTLAEVRAGATSTGRVIEGKGAMVGPNQKLVFDTDESMNQVSFVTINDYGGRAESIANVMVGH
ncbi:fimbria/pilus periplasmic chaperone [Stenotrophomonas terrae]|uniref:fimbrial biogenesis chaperone n=1 Tax=Stenotrophomonas terrae TaxID=405446 RepID=UPI00320A6285